MGHYESEKAIHYCGVSV